MTNRTDPGKARTAILMLAESYKSDEAFLVALLVAGGLLLALCVLQFASGLSQGLSFLPV